MSLEGSEVNFEEIVSRMDKLNAECMLNMAMKLKNQRFTESRHYDWFESFEMYTDSSEVLEANKYQHSRNANAIFDLEVCPNLF